MEVIPDSESGSTETINTADVDDKDVLEGLFKENKDILDFLSSGLESNEQNKNITRNQKKLRGISEEKDGNYELTGKNKTRPERFWSVVLFTSKIIDYENIYWTFFSYFVHLYHKNSRRLFIRKVFLISAKPEFVNALPATHTVPKGTSILMTCTIRGSPDPTVTWFRRDKALSHEDTDVTIERDGDECCLSINQCEPQDEGSYSCTIKNRIGQTTCSTNLEVQGVFIDQPHQ